MLNRVIEVPVESCGGPSHKWRASEMGEEWVVGQPMTYGSPVNGDGLVKELR